MDAHVDPPILHMGFGALTPNQSWYLVLEFSVNLDFHPMVWFQFLVNKNQIMTKLKCCEKQLM